MKTIHLSLLLTSFMVLLVGMTPLWAQGPLTLSQAPFVPFNLERVEEFVQDSTGLWTVIDTTFYTYEKSIQEDDSVITFASTSTPTLYKSTYLYDGTLISNYRNRASQGNRHGYVATLMKNKNLIVRHSWDKLRGHWNFNHYTAGVSVNAIDSTYYSAQTTPTSALRYATRNSVTTISQRHYTHTYTDSQQILALLISKTTHNPDDSLSEILLSKTSYAYTMSPNLEDIITKTFTQCVDSVWSRAAIYQEVRTFKGDDTLVEIYDSSNTLVETTYRSATSTRVSTHVYDNNNREVFNHCDTLYSKRSSPVPKSQGALSHRQISEVCLYTVTDGDTTEMHKKVYSYGEVTMITPVVSRHHQSHKSAYSIKKRGNTLQISMGTNSEYSLHLFTLRGQEVRQKRFTTTASLALLGLARGAYIVQIQGERSVHSQRIRW